MTSRLNIIQRERRCSRCEEVGHTSRNCNFTTIDEYCRLRENAELFQFPPIRVNRPEVVSVLSTREFREMFLQFVGQENNNVLTEEKKEIKLFYYHIEDENDNNNNMECGICLADDIRGCRMAKLNCGHSFCDRCTDNLITEEKSCCALCRAEITKVEVNSGESYGVLKDNIVLSTF
jgi:hypothetical protein